MAREIQQSEVSYFQMYGLTAQAPEALNESLRHAIESMHRTLYAPSRTELTPSELALLERTGVDVEEHPDRSDPMIAYATEFGGDSGHQLVGGSGQRLDWEGLLRFGFVR